MVYRENPSSLRSLPRPKSSRVHCSTPRRSDTLQGNVTCSPTVAIWSNGSRRNDCLVADDAVAVAARESKRSGNMVDLASFKKGETRPLICLCLFLLLVLLLTRLPLSFCHFLCSAPILSGGHVRVQSQNKFPFRENQAHVRTGRDLVCVTGAYSIPHCRAPHRTASSRWQWHRWSGCWMS